MSPELSRRRFLEGCAALCGAVLVGCNSNSAPTIQVSSLGSDKWALENVPDVQQGEAVAFQFKEGEPGLLFKTPTGELAAISAKCTHQGCTVAWTHGAPEGAFACPCHRSEFALDGKPLAGPTKKPLPRYAVKSSGGGAYELSPEHDKI